MDLIISKEELEIGSPYILFYMDKYIIGRLIGVDHRYSVRKEIKIVNEKQVEISIPNKLQYISAIIKGKDEFDLSKSPIISEMFHVDGKEEQTYFTNALLFKNSFIKIKAYEWMINHMFGINPFKVDKKNSDIAVSIALSMLKKDNPMLPEEIIENKIKHIFKKVSLNILDEVEERMQSVRQHQLNQLPF